MGMGRLQSVTSSGLLLVIGFAMVVGCDSGSAGQVAESKPRDNKKQNEGDGSLTAVPNVVDLPTQDAIKELEVQGLIAKVTSTETTVRTKNETVARQSPAGGSMIARDSTVALTVYQYIPPAKPRPTPPTEYEPVDEGDGSDVGPDIPVETMWTRPLSPIEVARMGTFERDVMRNAPYARRGYRFRRADLRDFFSQYAWYEPTSISTESAARSFSRLENQNLKLFTP